MAITPGSIVEPVGAPAIGRQPMQASVDMQEYNTQLKQAIAGTITPIGITTADIFPYVDSVTKEVHFSSVSDMFDNAKVIAINEGTGASIVSTVTPTAMAIFTGNFYSSTPALTDTAGSLGITLGVPSRFKVTVTASIQAATNTDFDFQIYIGNVACGRIVHASGIGASKDVNFSLQCISQTVNVMDTAELRVSDLDGDTIVAISVDMIVEFAGL